MYTIWKWLFGQAPQVSSANKPWAELKAGVLLVPVWRNRLAKTDSTQRRYVFGFSRPYRVGDREMYAKTFDVNHIGDLLKGLHVFVTRVSKRNDIREAERRELLRYQEAIALALDRLSS